MQNNKKVFRATIIVVVITIIIMIVYWWTTPSIVAPVVTDQNAVYAQMASRVLRDSNVVPTQQELSQAQKQLSASKVIVTNAQKQAIVGTLRKP